MEDLNVTLIQSDIYFEDPEKNLDHFGSVIDGLSSATDLIILPEMFSTGFSMDPQTCAETMDGRSVSFMKEKAAKKSCAVAGSVFIEDQGSYFNRMVCMQPDGMYEQYDKRHLFPLSPEPQIMTKGNGRSIFTCKEWRILPQICYDLRFPVWSRNLWNNGAFDYDILVYIANWPGSRSEIWKSLLIARAIENHCFVLGVNRIGQDPSGTTFSGDTMIASPDGKIIDIAPGGQPAVIEAVLSYQWLSDFRSSFPYAADWDSFTVQP
jgi:omega-amidase